MYTVFLAGGIASGKSSVARELERRGAWRIDLDQVSRAVLEPGSDCLPEIADAFGDDLLDPQTGELDRGLLAGRAFADAEAYLIENALVIPLSLPVPPYIATRLNLWEGQYAPTGFSSNRLKGIHILDHYVSMDEYNHNRDAR